MRKLLLLLTLVSGATLAAPSLTAPPTANMGTQVEVTVIGAVADPDAYLTVVAKGSPQGAYESIERASGPGKYLVAVGVKPGDFEIWLCQSESRDRVILARRPIRVLPVSATVAGPTQGAAGAQVEVRWTGPNYGRDYIAIGTVNPDEQIALTYSYTSDGNPLKVELPDKDGEYVIRYLTGEGNVALAQQRIKVGGVSANVTPPAKVEAGAPMSVQWTGPNNPRDFLTIVKAGAEERTWWRDAATAEGNPSKFTAPDAPGEYEVRYLTGQGNTLARARFVVGAVSGSISGPAQVIAGESFKVSWKGPDNPRNFITVVPKGAREGEYNAAYAYTDPKNAPVNLVAPLQPGDYELRYSTSETYYTLARAPLKVMPGKQDPGKVSVTQAPGTKSSGAVELILDASGSMLQKLGATRRIDIARQTLTKLTSSTIPPGTPFALRVFGREVDSCQTDLDVPVSPLNPAAVGKRIAALNAKNGAKTPIGASLAKVAEDLKSVNGEKLVVLITDGEETCGGDPAAEIHKLRKAGIGTRVSIVGFALDDQKLAAAFRRWSDLGGGAFFDAKDGAGLEKSLNAALRPGFEVVNVQGQVIASGIVGGDPVETPAGDHTVRIKGRANTSKPVTVSPKQIANVTL